MVIRFAFVSAVWFVLLCGLSACVPDPLTSPDTITQNAINDCAQRAEAQIVTDNEASRATPEQGTGITLGQNAHLLNLVETCMNFKGYELVDGKYLKIREGVNEL